MWTWDNVCQRKMGQHQDQCHCIWIREKRRSRKLKGREIKWELSVKIACSSSFVSSQRQVSFGSFADPQAKERALCDSVPYLWESHPPLQTGEEGRCHPETFTQLMKGVLDQFLYSDNSCKMPLSTLKFWNTHLNCSPFKVYWTAHPIRSAEFLL